MLHSPGSPPQVRGKHDRHVKRLLIVRITPAGAGKTSSPVTSVNPPQDHPRRCGENHYTNGVDVALAGITPAGAGKTFFCPPSSTAGKDHPRRCGENLNTVRRLTPAFGSPPQVRGKHFQAFFQTQTGRITPAGAGKTYWFDSAIVTKRDHPRRCGENLLPASV